MGLLAGVIAQAVTASGPQANPYATLETSAMEPPAAADVRLAILNDDPRALASLIGDEELLQALSEALQPLLDVREVKFIRAVDKDGKILSAYVAKGRDASGQGMIVGYVLRVQNEEVVGVN